MYTYTFKINWKLPIAFFLLGWGGAVWIIYEMVKTLFQGNTGDDSNTAWMFFIFFSIIMIASAIVMSWQSIVELTTRYDEKGITRLIRLQYKRISWESIEKIEVLTQITGYAITGSQPHQYKARRVRIQTCYGRTLLILNYYRDKYELLKLILDKTPSKAKESFSVPENLRDYV